VVNHFPRRRLSAVLSIPLVVAICAATAGVAAAYWSGPGNGTGSALTANAEDLTVSSGTPADFLSPGAQAAVVLTVSNPNPTAVHIASLERDTTRGTGGFAVDSGHSGCALSTLSFTTQTNTGAGWTVPMRTGGTDGTLSLTLVNAVSMAASAANSCQGALFTVYLRTSS
jgi:hypothetical protein